MTVKDLLLWPQSRFAPKRNRFSQIVWICTAVLAFIAASLAAAQSPAAPWTGQVICNLTLQNQGYNRQETQTWTIAGPMLRMNGVMQIYPVKWTVSGSGSAQRLQGGLASTVQWNTSVPSANLTFSIYVRASDRRLIFTQWGSQASSDNAIRGLRQAVWNGAQQQAASITRPAWEWHFPPIEADQADTNPSGTFQTATEALPAELAGPRDAPAIANCAWHFNRNDSSSQPVLASNTVTTQKGGTLSQTPTVNPSLGSPKPISQTPISNGPAVQVYSGLTPTTPSGTAQKVNAAAVGSVSTAKMLSSTQPNTASTLMAANTQTAPAQVTQTNSTDPSAGNAGNAGTAASGTSDPNATNTTGNFGSSAADPNTNANGTDPSASPNGAAAQTVKVFLNPGNAPSFTYTWTPPAGVTQVTVQIWGGGGSGALGTGIVTASGGSGGGYSSKLLNVTPGVIYNIIVGGGGQGPNVFGNASGQDGYSSSITSGGKTLLFAGGGYKGVLDSIEPVAGGTSDSSATVGQPGGIGTTAGGGPAFQSDSCPGFGITGRGGDASQYGQPGCVVVTW